MNTVFVLDLDTQKDLVLSSGALPSAGADRLIPKFRRLFDFVRKTGATVVSTVHSHPGVGADLHGNAPHCQVGSDGQRKLDDTLLRRPLVLENRPLDLNLVEAVRKHQQIVIERERWDPFSNPVLEKLLRALPAYAFLFGVPVEHTVLLAALGLRQRGLKAAVLSDMVMALEPKSAAAAGREMRQAGVEFVTLETMLSVYSGTLRPPHGSLH